MSMKPAGQVLALLRKQPATACAAWGFMCRGAPINSALGGNCIRVGRQMQGDFASRPFHWKNGLEEGKIVCRKE